MYRWARNRPTLQERYSTNMSDIYVTPEIIDILASSGLYDVVLNDGARMDLMEFIKSFGFNDGSFSGGLLDFVKDNINNFGDKLREIVHKPLKALPYVAAAYGVGAIGSGGPELIAKLLGSAKSSLGNLVESKNFGAIQDIIKNTLQQGGIVPTNDQINAGVQQIIDGTVWQDFPTTGQVSQVKQQAIPLSVDKLIPYFAIGLSIFALWKR